MRLVVDVINGLIARFDQFFASRQRNPADRWRTATRKGVVLFIEQKQPHGAATVKAEPRSKTWCLDPAATTTLERAMQLAHRRIDDIKTDAASRQLGGFLFGRKTGTQKQRTRPRFRWPSRLASAAEQQAFLHRHFAHARHIQTTPIVGDGDLDGCRAARCSPQSDRQRRLAYRFAHSDIFRYRGRRSFAPSAAVAS